MGPRHTREEILDGAVAAALAGGLNQLTFGSLAKRLGMNDRTIVYYFPTKLDLLVEVVDEIGWRLKELLASAFSKPATDPIALARAAWPVLTRPDAAGIFALFSEANGLASAGLAPYNALVPAISQSWIYWMTEFLPGTADERLADAEAAMAVIHGLLFLLQVGGPAAAHRAASRLGVV